MSYYLGIDIGGTNLRAALIDEDGKLIEKFKVENEVIKGPEYNIDKLVLGIKERWGNKKIKYPLFFYIILCYTLSCNTRYGERIRRGGYW